jgi:hypothetical protein
MKLSWHIQDYRNTITNTQNKTSLTEIGSMGQGYFEKAVLTRLYSDLSVPILDY